jgi:BASS family bile acid:Na+ symporter
MMNNLPTIGPIVLILNVAIMAIGFGLAGFAKTGFAAAKAISLEGGLQNGAIGIFVATTLVGNTTMAIPSITYALIMNVSALGFIVASQAGKHKKNPSSPG